MEKVQLKKASKKLGSAKGKKEIKNEKWKR